MPKKDLTRHSPAARRASHLGYIPADRRQVGSIGPLSIAYNAVLGTLRRYTTWGGLFLNPGHIDRHARHLVNEFDVRTPSIHFEAGKLSGGNLQKVVLGRELLARPTALVVEQPTRGLDVGATEYVHRQLLAERSRGAALLLISAELEEILALSDRIAVLYQGKIMGVLTAGAQELNSQIGTKPDDAPYSKTTPSGKARLHPTPTRVVGVPMNWSVWGRQTQPTPPVQSAKRWPTWGQSVSPPSSQKSCRVHNQMLFKVHIMSHLFFRIV